MRYALREALLAFRRAPLLAALGVATIAFSLFSLGLFGLVALNIRDALARVEERVEVRAFFADSTPPPAVTAAAVAVREYPGGERVDVGTSAQALARVAVLARTREIQLMRLVGATDAFVRLPFLIEGALAGLAGGLLALGLTRLAQVLVSRYVLRVEFFPGWVAALGVLLGAALGLLASLLSVGRHLRLVGGERRRLWR